jgi:hypothetical protein
MSMRLKAMAIIVTIVILIAASSTGVGIYFSETRLLETIADDMAVVGKIAVKMVAARLNLLKTETDTVALECLNAAVYDAETGEKTLSALLQAEMVKHRFFRWRLWTWRARSIFTASLCPMTDSFKVPTPNARSSANGS